MLANYPFLDIDFLLYVKYITSKNMERPNLNTYLTISLKSLQCNVSVKPSSGRLFENGITFPIRNNVN